MQHARATDDSARKTSTDGTSYEYASDQQVTKDGSEIVCGEVRETTMPSEQAVQIGSPYRTRSGRQVKKPDFLSYGGF